MGSSSNQIKEAAHRCFTEWMTLQEQDLTEMENILKNHPERTDELCSELSQKSLRQFQEYMDQRSKFYTADVSPYFAPSWCSTLENSLLWIAGCRPSSYIRLLYALCGHQVQSHLADFIHGSNIDDKIGELSPEQFMALNELHMKTVKEEDKLSTRFASLQEDIADHPISVIAKAANRLGEPSEEVDKALLQHDKGMVGILGEADKLRLKTVTELIKILKPVQGLEYLVASKKLHLCLHQWGQSRDQRYGRERGEGAA